ncbi:hypothetical protein GCM10009836_15410 [Pseudonocardia ailaonensis]|uniref:Integral membrane protein n=1 Tax=Pseudonocardia ailaonensis TaxID=367279 RepID=A0ABN2MTY5_9PSEU
MDPARQASRARPADGGIGPGGGAEAGEPPALNLAGFRALAARPRWLAGVALAGAGAGMHAVALVLAPVSIVQPVGVLAVPIAVGIALRGRWPGRGVVAGIALCAIGIALAVRTAAAAAPDTVADPGRSVLLAGTAAAALVLGLAVLAARTTGRIRCLACAAAGAVAFGVVSTILRAVSLQVAAGLAGPQTLLGAAAGVTVALAVGGWFVQQAFASGPPAVVVAVLTVVDPLVAVGLSGALLGEVAGLGAAGITVLVAAGLAAAAGVGLLARHHPDAARAAVPAPDSFATDKEEVLT